MTRTLAACAGILTTALTDPNTTLPVVMLGVAGALIVAGLIHATRCTGGCYCVKDRFAWRCVRCQNLCRHADEEVVV